MTPRGSSGLSLFHLLPLGAIAAWLWLLHRRGRQAVERWCQGQRLRLLEARVRWFSRGPFRWTASRSRLVWRLRVHDPASRRIRSAWLRVAGGDDPPEVVWDDPAQPSVGVSPASVAAATTDAPEGAGRPRLRWPAWADLWRSGWFRAGVALVVFGWGPLVTVIVAADLGLTRDPNPNPIGFGILFFLTAWPALICLALGVRRAMRAPRVLGD